MLAFLLQALDTLFRLFQRRQFLAVLDLGAFGQFAGRAFQLIVNAGLEFLDALGGGFRQGLGAGAFLARAGQRRVGRLGVLVGFRQHALRLLAGIGGFIASGFGKRDRVQQGAALLRDLFGHLFGAGEFTAQFFLTAGEFGNMALGIGLACIPARLFVADAGKTAHPGFAFAAQAFQGAARFAGLGAGIGSTPTRIGDILAELHAIAKLRQSGSGGCPRFFGSFHRLNQAAHFRFQRGQLRSALGGGARCAVGVILGTDQSLFGAAFLLFGVTQCFACGLGRILGGRIFRKLTGTYFPRLFHFAFQGGKAIALRQPHRGKRRRIGAGDKAVPPPQVAARRDQPLARLELALQACALIGKYQPGHRQAAAQCSRRLDEVAEWRGSGRQFGIEIKSSQIAPVMGRGIVQRRLQVIAQGSGQRRFVTGLHRHRIHQRGEQAFAFRMQQIAQRLHFGGEALHLMFGGFQGRAGCGFGHFRILEFRAGGGGGGTGILGHRAGPFGFVFARLDIGRVLGALQRRIQAGLRVRQLPLAALEQRHRKALTPFQAGLPGVPLRQFGGQALQQLFGVRQGLRHLGSQLPGAGEIFVRALHGGVEDAGFPVEVGQGAVGVMFQQLFALGIGLGLRDQLADALRGFAGALFFRVQLFALGDQAVMRRAALGFGLAQRRQYRGGIALRG